jgi:phosphoglycolate phosphatase
MLEPSHLLAPRVKAFYYRDNMQFHKPDPRAFNELLSANSLHPEECVYMGDSPSDAQAANGAGLHFIASLESGIRQQQDFEDSHVDAFIAQFPNILKAIANIERKLQPST